MVGMLVNLLKSQIIKNIYMRETLSKLAFEVNMASMPEAYEHVRNQLEDRISNLVSYCKENFKEIITIDGHTGYQLGTALDIIISKRGTKDLDFKFFVMSAIISLHQAIEMHTMQSLIAIPIFERIINYDKWLVDTKFLDMDNEFMVEKFNMPIELLPQEDENAIYDKELLNWKKEKVHMYLSEFKKMADAFKNTNIQDCLRGKYYFDALYYIAQDKIRGWEYLGIII